MKVVIAAGGRFHAHHLAQQMQAQTSLEAFFTFDYHRRDKEIISPSLVHVAQTCKMMNDLFVRLRIARFMNPSYFNHLKDNMFDRFVAKTLNQMSNFDIFIGWAHYALNAISVAKKRGALVIIESGSCHIATQEAILQQEYDRWGLAYKPIHPLIKEKMLKEYQQADYIMTLSTFARNSFIQHQHAPDKILSIPCGAKVEPLCKNPITYGHRSKKFRVLFIGLISLRKGVQNLILAWHKAALPVHETELVIVGAMQHDFISIKEKLPIAPNVIFTGPQSRVQVHASYKQASVFVLPSLEEGFGMVIGEAMTHALPIICTNNSAGPDIIEHNKHGFLIDAGNTETLAHYLSWCFENQEQAAVMGSLGQQHIQKWSWKRYGESVYETYQKLLDNRKERQ